MGNKPVKYWLKMRKMLKARFLPNNYEQILYQSYHDCKQYNQTIDEYTGEWYR